MLLQLVDDAQRLQVVLEAAEIRHAFVERVLAGVAEGRVSEVVGEADGLGQHLVEAQRAGDGPRDLRDLERMRQPGAVEIALVIDENLGLVDQTAEGRGMHDAVAVALVFGRDRRGGGSAWRRPRDWPSWAAYGASARHREILPRKRRVERAAPA